MEPRIRRGVTGHGSQGEAVVLADGQVPTVHGTPMRPGQRSFEVWKTRAMPTLRLLFAAHPELPAPELRIVHRVITRLLLSQAGPRRSAADAGAITLIQRFGSAANLDIHRHCLVLDGVYRRTEGEPRLR